jgi:hypothetical protein
MALLRPPPLRGRRAIVIASARIAVASEITSIIRCASAITLHYVRLLQHRFFQIRYRDIQINNAHPIFDGMAMMFHRLPELITDPASLLANCLKFKVLNNYSSQIDPIMTIAIRCFWGLHPNSYPRLDIQLLFQHNIMTCKISRKMDIVNIAN